MEWGKNRQNKKLSLSAPLTKMKARCLFLACIFLASKALLKQISPRSVSLSRKAPSTRVWQGRPGVAGVYLERLVARKKKEVDTLLRRHQDSDDPLVMRMSYMASECKYEITKSLKLDDEDKDRLHRMTVTVDMKKYSPTVPHKRNIVEFSSAGTFAGLLTEAGTDAFLINTDSIEYGGQLSDLSEARREVDSQRPPPGLAPACICKDLIIHPVQIAQALQNGASGVLLITAVVGADLEPLLDACTLMGTEALVEVHTPNELEFALSKGATIFLVNQWDRMTGEYFPEQAKGLASMLPMNSVAVVGGNINSVEQAAEIGFYGYDGIVLGRALAELPDVKAFIDDIHDIRGPPRGMAMGMKGLPYAG
jgi:indole-3-glycerol phosphate synthase